MNKILSHTELQKLAEEIIPIAHVNIDKYATGMEFKSANDAVTDLDRLLQDCMIGQLKNLHPDIPCLSEECLTDIRDDELAFILDPLDGTSNYIQGLRPSALALAQVRGNLVLAALVIDFSNFDLYTAVSGHGALLNGKPLSTGCHGNIRLLGASTGYLRRGGKIPENWNVRVLGSQALQLCFVATGTLSANVSYEAKAWDDVAGSLILEEAGGSYENNFRNLSWVSLAKSQQPLFSVAIGSRLSLLEKNMVSELI